MKRAERAAWVTGASASLTRHEALTQSTMALRAASVAGLPAGGRAATGLPSVLEQAFRQYLPRQRVEIDVPAADKQCACGHAKQRIGASVSEKLEYVPAGDRNVAVEARMPALS
jgi:hypothetical protein